MTEPNTNPCKSNQSAVPVVLVEGEGVEGSVGDSLARQMHELSTDNHLLAIGESSSSTAQFERVIGAIEEIVVGEEFQSLQNHFLSTYWKQFSETQSSASQHGERSKLEERHEHYKIYQAYSQDMANLLETQLRRTFRDEHFNFNNFVEEFCRRVELGQSSDQLLESEIFEMLFTLTDFVKFKELFMDYKAMMEGKTPNLSTGISLKSLSSSTLRGS